ncbi:hypothetical protein GMLC_38840 [Geomonas limicola]|uniref:Uncharacterized protein n=1 Tax=Geomonas limicola TaxID=2740186 RepID=A0A6V8NCG6_9BACT|nr:hypothetical protein [Geomonas limicola]GFO70305.1 hypothetical protein GMLC_38840 [Geomonas limicola]
MALDREQAKSLFEKYRKHRDGIRSNPELAGVCLICGSTHVGPHPEFSQQMICHSCGFAFYRYRCPDCGATVDGRDPLNPACRECGLRQCTCGACGCRSSYGSSP